jgi:fumarate reductase flavoprotein subunit
MNRGGVKINESTEVVDKKSRIIAGLYAVGLDAGGVWGDSYLMKGSNSAGVGFAANSGRIAGKDVLGYLGKQEGVAT